MEKQPELNTDFGFSVKVSDSGLLQINTSLT